MPAIITPSTDPLFPASLSCPRDGEALSATQEQVLDQQLLDGVEAARLRLYKLNGQRTACYNSTDITIEPLGAVTVMLGGQWLTYPHLVKTTLPTSGLVGGTRYWIYAYSLAGALAFTWSVDAPDAALAFKNGDQQYAYVGTFYTFAGTAIMRYTQDGNSFLYNDASTQNNRVVAGGNAVGGTTTALSVSCPTQARSVLMLGSLPTSGAGRSAFIRSTTDIRGLTLLDDGANTAIGQVEFSLNGLFSFDWGTSSAGCALDVYVYGFTL